MQTRNRLQEIRETRGIGAAQLAKRIGVSRQAIYAMESGSYVPNTAIALQLARALEVRVEDLFSLAGEDLREPGTVSAELLAGGSGAEEGQPVRLCRVGERLVAVPSASFSSYLPAADGVIETKSRSRVSVKAASELPEDGKRLLLAGCDPAISLLTQMLEESAGIEIVSIPCSSRRALDWLREGKVHAAGSHLLDHATGDYNVPFVKRLFPNGGVRVVTFALWEEGIVVRRGNPKSIGAIADVGRKGVTLVNRERGAGSRDLLDAGLRSAGIASDKVAGYDHIALGHLPAASLVASGKADCCIATRSAAKCFGLDFVPLAVERYDLVIPGQSLELPAAKALLELLNRARLRRKLEAIAGYDTAHTGEVLFR